MSIQRQDSLDTGCGLPGLSETNMLASTTPSIRRNTGSSIEAVPMTRRTTSQLPPMKGVLQAAGQAHETTLSIRRTHSLPLSARHSIEETGEPSLLIQDTNIRAIRSGRRVSVSIEPVQEAPVIRKACCYRCHCQCHEQNQPRPRRRSRNLGKKKASCNEVTCVGYAGPRDVLEQHTNVFRKVLARVIPPKTLTARCDFDT
jgi:hypothetical protein